MPKPGQISTRQPLSKEELDSACYVGSPEHKVVRWWGGLPQAHVGTGGVATRPGRQTTTICPLVSVEERDIATLWVRAALALGQHKFFEGDKIYPHFIWYRDNGQVWMGRCVNGILGTYKGWPIEESERIEVFD